MLLWQSTDYTACKWLNSVAYILENNYTDDNDYL